MTHKLTTSKDTPGSCLFRSTALTLAAFGLLFATPNANAACGDPAQGRTGIAAALPSLLHNGAAQAHASNSADTADDRDNRSIVGLWHVTFTFSDGTPFYESFDLWHSDRTEMESANGSPITGNVCVGVWKETERGTVKLHHLAWTFNSNGTLTGSSVLNQTNTVARGGATYKGTFVYTIYDIDGNFINEFTGTVNAIRITVD